MVPSASAAAGEVFPPARYLRHCAVAPRAVMSDSKRMPRTLPGSAQSRKVFQPVLLPPLSARNLSRSSYPDAPVLRLFSPFRDDSAHAVCKKGRRGNLADWSHRAAFSRPFCFSGIPFRSAGEAAVKTPHSLTGRRLPVCRCDSLPHLGLRCGFKATAWAPFYPHSTRDDTIQRESHRAVIDAR